MIDLPSALIQAKNQVADADPWILLVQVEIDDSDVLRLAANQNEDITWNGQTWQWFPIEVGDIRHGKQKTYRLDVKVSNINRAVQEQIEEFHGAADAPITFYVVHAGNLAQTTVPSWSFLIEETVADPLWVTFTVGPYYKLDRRSDPKDKMYKNFCRFNFPNSVDSRCPYDDVTYTECNRTLADCIERNGDSAYLFGGFPTIGKNKLYV